MKHSEIVLDLIEVAFANRQTPAKVTLRECIDMLMDMREAEAKESTPVKTDKIDKPKDTPATKTEKRVGVEPMTGSETTIRTAGKGAAEKRAIHQRLVNFREKHGLGSIIRLAKHTNGALTDDEIRSMLNCAPATISKYRLLNAALDYEEGQEDG